MKYISPGSWFSLEYPAGWNEFEDTEDSFQRAGQEVCRRVYGL